MNPHRSSVIESCPAMVHSKPHPKSPQPLHPSAQQRCSLHHGRKNFTTRRNERLNSKLRCPCTHRVVVKIRKAPPPKIRGHRIAGVLVRKNIQSGIIRKIQPAFSCHEKLPTNRALRIKERHICPGLRSDFGSAQPSRPASDDADMFSSAQNCDLQRRLLWPAAEDVEALHGLTGCAFYEVVLGA